MKPPTLVLLPGLHGTSGLFASLQHALPAEVRTIPVAYPGDRPLGYDDLLPLVLDSLPEEPYVLLAESFSGPLAVRIAARRPPDLLGLVLVASFVRCPLSPPWAKLARLVSPVLFHLPRPSWVLRRFLMEDDQSGALVGDVRDAVSSVHAAVLARRLGEVLRVDAGSDLEEVEVPVVYLKATRDRVLSRDCVEVVKGGLPGMEVVSVEGPHMLLQVRPKEAAAEILRFCQSVRSA